MMKKIIYFSFSLTFFLVSLLSLPSSILAEKIFYEDFNDGDADGWIRVDDPDRTPCSANWRITEDNMFGIAIDQHNCTTNIMPNDTLWNDLGGNYIIDLDIMFVKGTDHNVAFRFTPSTPTNDWYDIHFQSPNGFVLERVPPGPQANNVLYPVPNRDLPYHVKIVVQTGNIKVFIDKNLALDYPYDPSDEKFPTGRVALRAGAGADPVSETYFDNVVVTSLGNTPVVLLPGIGAGWNKRLIYGGEAADWGMNPLAYYLIYRKLINSFLESGFTEGEDFFVYNYDWRKPFNETAEDFDSYLQSIEVPKVDVVGHSMGGMVSRAYLQNNPDHKIEKLITVGSPHQGALQAYPAWEAGEFWETTPLLKSLMEIPIHVRLITHPFETRVEAVKALFPSLQDFLPTFDFLQDKKTGQLKDISLHRQKNQTVIQLNEALTQEHKSFLQTIYGNSFPTLERITMQSGKPLWYDRILDLWEDGRPACDINLIFDSECPEAIIRSDQGEGTVLTRSATIEGVAGYELTLKHTDLVREAAGIEKILEVLGVDGQVADDWLSEITDVVFFLILSPAQILVTDPAGQQIGFGTAADSIEGGFYDEESKLVMLANPLEGSYHLRVLGEANGTYRLLSGRVTTEETQLAELFGETGEGDGDNFLFNLTGNNLSVVDPTGLVGLESAEKRLINLKSLLHNQESNLLEQILRRIKKTKQLMEQKNSKLAVLEIESLIRQIYLLRGRVGMEYQGELEKASLDCQEADFNLSSLGNLTATKKWAEINLENAKRSLERFESRAGKVSSKEAALSFLLAQEYLRKVQEALEETEYSQALLYSSIVKYLCLEI